MKKIIFRNPFITEENKKMGMSYLITSEACFKCAEEIRNRYGKFSRDAYRYHCEGVKNQKRAAKKLGFLSVKNMMDYQRIHVKLI